MKRSVRIFVFCIFFAGLSTVIFAQENEEEDFPKNAVSAGLIYMGLGLEYERLITTAFGVAGGIFAYWTGSMLQWGYMVQGRVHNIAKPESGCAGLYKF